MDAEAKLLAAACQSREAYEVLRPHIQPMMLNEMGKVVWSYVNNFYAKDGAAESVDLDLLQLYLVNKYPKQRDGITEYLATFPTNVSTNNVIDHFIEVRRTELANEMIQSLVKRNWDTVHKNITAFMEIADSVNDTEEIYHAKPLDSFFEHGRGDLIPLAPTKLNDKLDGGGIPRQSQVCVFARSNVGKSTFSANLAGALVKQGYKVLYLGNEDSTTWMVSRIIARLAGAPINSVRANAERLYGEAMQAGLDRFWFAPMAPGTVADIRSNTAAVRPDVVIVDQIYGMALADKSGPVQAFANIVGATRSIAKEFNCVMVVVTQAGESAVGKVILKDTDIEWSNTGVCAQMDLMIGIGQNEDMNRSGRAVLSFPKYKFGPLMDPIDIKIDYLRQRVLA